MNRGLRLTAKAILLWAGSTTVAIPATGQEVFFRQEIELSLPSASATLVATIEWGELNVRAHDREMMVVELVDPAHERARGGPPAARRAELVLSEQNNVVRLAPTEDPRRRFESAYVTVWVPRRSNLNLRIARGGEITVDGVIGDIEISNQNGSVHMSDAGGAVVVDAVNGEIVARLTELASDADMWFTALNGQVDLTLPDGWSADVYLDTENGRILSDFEIRSDPVETRTQPAGTTSAIGSHTLRGSVGSGGAAFRATTRSGDVILRRASGAASTR